MRSKYTALATIGLTLGMTLGSGEFASANALTGVYSAMVNGGLEVVIMGNALAKPRVVKVGEGKEIRFEFDGELGVAEGSKSYRTGAVKSIRYGWYDKLHSTTAVVATLRRPSDPKIDEIIGGWKVRFDSNEPNFDADPLPVVKLPSVSSQISVTPVIGVIRQIPIAFIGAMPGIRVPKAKPNSLPQSDLLKAKPVAKSGAAKVTTEVEPTSTEPAIVKPTVAKPTKAKLVVEKPVIAKVTTIKPEAKEGKAKAGHQDDPMGRLVSLDFTNTDVVQILKAITIQAGVNIVTAPEVKQSISVSMDRVTVTEALNVVTQIAKLAYRKQGNVYMVSVAETAAVAPPTAPVMPLISNRIVPIFSGDAKEIRASVLAFLSAQRSLGSYQIFLPKDAFSIDKSSQPGALPGQGMNDVKLGPTTGSPADKQADSSSDKADATVRFNGLREQYLMLIGPTDHIDEVVSQVRETDKMIASAYGRDVSGSQELVSHSYSVKSDRATAADLVKAMSADGSNLNVDLIATPKTYVNQVVIINGRESNVKRAEAMLTQLDASGYGSEFVVYDVKFTDPRSLRESLIGLIPGLRVSLAPNGAGNPGLFNAGENSRQAQEVQNPATAQQAGSQSSQNNSVTTSSSATLSDVTLESPFSASEKQAVPMRIVLRGTEDQIAQARAYIAKLDIPQKQVAIELRVMELTKADSVNAGIDWNILGGGAVKFLRLNNSQTTPSNSIGGNISGNNFSGDVTASLDALGSNGKLIARPNAFVQDGRQAELFVGDTVRYVASISQTQNGTTIVTGEVPVGVRFAVLPRIGGDGNVTLDIRPRLSILKGFTDIPNGGKLPQTSGRIEGSTLTMKSGQTIAIGGLIQDQDSATISGIPFLKDFPIIGQLFRKSTTQRSRTEVVFFLTVKVIDGPVDGGTTSLMAPQQDTKPDTKKRGSKPASNTSPMRGGK